MHFTQLRLAGFKSFVEPVDLDILPGLTGIVGPNGCGKSNLLEALRWVMGESSIKSMRAAAMEDVIFSGTAGRPTRNLAQVTLVIDNSTRTAPAAWNEEEVLEVTRFIERGGGSAYRINGRDVRARDVRMFFADIASGSHSPAFVRQGRITEIITAKPTARRHILEEAAGITGLYTRRHEAELRLKAAETNLLRLDDVINQIKTQLANLKKQARQATRYRNISSHIRRDEAIVFYLKWTDAQETLSSTIQRLNDIDAVLVTHTRAAAQASTALEKADATLQPLHMAEAEAAAALHRLSAEEDNLKAEKRRVNEQLEQLAEFIRQTSEDRERDKAAITEAQHMIQQLAEEKVNLEQAQASHIDKLQKAESTFEAARTALMREQTDLDEITSTVAQHQARSTSLSHQEEELRARYERLQQQQRETETEKATLSPLVRDISYEGEAIHLAGSISAEAREEAERAIQETKEALTQARQAQEQAREKLSTAERNSTALTAEINTLQRLLVAGSSDNASPLSNAVTPLPGYETALWAALGETLEASLDISAPAHWREMPTDPSSIPPLPEGATPISEYITAPPALARYLAYTGLVPREIGVHLQTQLYPGQRLVSQEGDLWCWDGYTANMNASSHSVQRIVARNRLDALTNSLAEQNKTTEKNRHAAQEANDHENACYNAWSAAINNLSHLQKAKSNALEKYNEQQSRLAALDDMAKWLASEIKTVQTALATVNQERKTLPDVEQMKQYLDVKKIAIDERRQALTEAQGSHDILHHQANRHTEQQAGLARNMEIWERRLSDAIQHRDILQTRLEESQRTQEQVKSVPQEITERRERLIEQTEIAEVNRREIADKLAIAEKNRAASDARAKETANTLSVTREERAREGALVEGAKERVNEITLRIQESLSCQPESLLTAGGVKTNERLPSIEQAEARLERLKRERENLGGVNLRADEETEALSEQLTTLTTERTDLEEAISSLRKGINRLNRESRMRLLAAFDEVNENFQHLFSHLFSGGVARLELVESDDPLEAGLEIMARPPGKRLQSLSLLSGGEQSLTALALIFAVFLTNPSPICVLDEADAALDDANVERFCTLINQMVERTPTRFLVVTHHPLTMARTSRLFGVTMQERGVSQLVSVDLNIAEQFLETG
ncbi:MAG: chromosome segregation protein SMC [Parvularculales bacterium]